MTRPTTPCVICRKPDAIPERGLVCEPCRVPLPGLLDDIAALHGELDLTPASNTGQKVTGSREAPLPLALDPLDLSMPARQGAVADIYGDQTGHLSTATVLDAWVRDWRETRRRGERLPVPVVGVLARWLRDRLDWAADEHPAVGELATEMRTLRQALRAATGDIPAKPQRLWVPCKCDALGLARHPGDDYPVRCAMCGRAMTEDDYAVWARMVAASMQRSAA